MVGRLQDGREADAGSLFDLAETGFEDFEGVQIKGLERVEVLRTEFTYDSPLTTGNVTVQRHWDSTKPTAYSIPLTDANSIKSQYTYDASGNVTSTTDANNNVTSFVVNGCSGSTRSAYPTSITVGGLTLGQTWDCSSGLLKTATDPNSIITQRTYDTLGRTTLIQEALGTPRERQTEIAYTESGSGLGATFPLIVTTKSDLGAKADKLLVTTKKFDQRGHVAETIQPDGSILRHLSPVVLDLDRATLEATSNPYSTGAEPTAGWTLTQRDQLGRLVYTTHYTGSDPPYPWGNNLTSSGTSSAIYNGYSTLSKDQANRSRQSIVDAQGRLKTVIEDPGVGRLGYLTTYTYDALDNLKTVNQGGLSRAFAYSSLKRLTSAQNPESGTIDYGYDAAGNLLNRTELRVSLAISGYDALNRPLSKNYTPNTTPAVSYSYDTCANGKGRLCGMASTASSTAYTYDELGRTAQATQTTGIAYFTKYAYNLADGVTSVEFPGSTVTLPRKVSYQYDPAGRVIAVYRGEIGSADKYVQSVAYWPGGAEKTTTLGNNVVEETSLNARLQMTGRTAMVGASTLWGAAAYTYGVTANNGNPLTQTVSAPAPFTQTYWYDSLNRLQAVHDSLIGVPSFRQSRPGERILQHRRVAGGSGERYPDCGSARSRCRGELH